MATKYVLATSIRLLREPSLEQVKYDCLPTSSTLPWQNHKCSRSVIMASDQPPQLPIYYGERTADGRIIKRPSTDPETSEPLGSPPARTSAEQQFPTAGPTIRDTQIPDVETASDVFNQGPRQPPSAVQRWGTVGEGRAVDSRSWRNTAASRRRLNDEYYLGEFSSRPYVEYDDEVPLRRAGSRSYATLKESRSGPLMYRGGSLADRTRMGDGPPPSRPITARIYSEDDDPYRADGGGRGPPDDMMRLPMMWWMNSSAKNHFVACLGEFIGTFLFLFFAFAGATTASLANPKDPTTGDPIAFNPAVYIYIAFVFGFSLLVNAWIFYRISGSLFNPAITLGMVLVRALTVTRGILVAVAQLLGGIFAAFMVSVLYPGDFNVRTTLASNTSTARGVFIEAVGTSLLVFTVFMLAKEKHKATYVAPVGIGLALFTIHLATVYYTGSSVNPARSFGPCVVNGKFDSEHWIYWVGPALGALLAYLFFTFLKMLEYETANPGQDAAYDDEAKETADLLKEKRSMGSMRVRQRFDSLKGGGSGRDAGTMAGTAPTVTSEQQFTTKYPE
ncbi:aquaporin-like protein [Phyllosticta citriasiana]|uniref:aquaporin-like protein n=1 Tax=Phyllosticta citriasiana TaxID=595635 RepID=UPI0030FDB0EB